MTIPPNPRHCVVCGCSALDDPDRLTIAFVNDGTILHQVSMHAPCAGPGTDGRRTVTIGVGLFMAEVIQERDALEREVQTAVNAAFRMVKAIGAAHIASDTVQQQLALAAEAAKELSLGRAGDAQASLSAIEAELSFMPTDDPLPMRVRSLRQDHGRLLIENEDLRDRLHTLSENLAALTQCAAQAAQPGEQGCT